MIEDRMTARTREEYIFIEKIAEVSRPDERVVDVV